MAANTHIKILNKTFTDTIDTFIVIDFETTGLNPVNDEIIEISALKYTNNALTDKYVTLVNPKRPVSSTITQLTGITNQMVRTAPSIETALPALLDFIGDTVLAAHNASFDMGFLRNSAQRLGREVLNPYICTLALSRKLYPELKNHKLATVSSHLGITEEGFHRAEFDCMAAALILIDGLKRKNAGFPA